MDEQDRTIATFDWDDKEPLSDAPAAPSDEAPTVSIADADDTVSSLAETEGSSDVDASLHAASNADAISPYTTSDADAASSQVAGDTEPASTEPVITDNAAADSTAASPIETEGSSVIDASLHAASDTDVISIDSDLTQDVTAEVRAYDDTIVGADTNDYLEGYKQYIDRYEAGRNAEDEARKAREEADRLEAAYGSIDTSYGASSGRAQQDNAASAPSQGSRSAYRRASQAAKAPARNNESKYVTKGFLVVCMVLTMLVSSVLGAFLGSTFGGNSGSSASGSKEVAEDNGQSQLSLTDATGSDMTIAQIVDKNADAVVEILVSGTSQNYFGQMQLTEGAGSGVIVKSDGYIVTNYHVIQGANKVQVTLHNGETYPASIVGGDSSKDIAVIKINASGLTTAEIGDSSTVAVGDTAVAIGNPLGQLGGTATTGIISALDRNLDIDGRTLTLMQTDAAINGGNSGGGLFNSKGQLIGIVDAKSSGVGIEGLAFAIPVNSVIDTINDLIENGTVTSRPVVGITIQDVSEENAQYYQLESAGVYIAQVTGENAQRAGFQQGDRIISLDGDEITDSQTFINKIRSHKAGDNVAIVVSRDGQEIEIRTELEQYTSAE